MRRTLLLLGLLAVLGCSRNTLDRKTAMEKINQEFSKQRVRIPVRIGRVGIHCETRTENGKTFELHLDPKTDTAVVMALAAGYADAAPDGDGFWKINLTDQGRAFVNAQHVVPEAPPASSHCGYQFYLLPLATAQVTEVTGIVPDQKASQVEFLWNWSLTEFGKDLRAGGKVYSVLDERHRDSLQFWFSANPGPTLPIPAPPDEELKTPHRETAQFVKYDDGWRVVK